MKEIVMLETLNQLNLLQAEQSLKTPIDQIPAELQLREK
jgi:hypothetical protein